MFLLAATSWGQAPAAGAGAPPALVVQSLVASLQGPRVAEAARVVAAPDDHVRFLGAPPSEFFPVAAPAGSPPEAVAQAFLKQGGAAFFRPSPALAFRPLRVDSAKGSATVRLEEFYAGLPVFGAQTLVQVNDAGGVDCVVADVLRDTQPLDTGTVSIVPTAAPALAQSHAIDFVRGTHPASSFSATAPVLMLYDPALRKRQGAVRLVWQTVVSALPPLVVKEFVLVDAHTGKVTYHFSKIENALNRQIYDANDVVGSDPGTPARFEGQGASSVTDVNLAYTYFGDTYNFYLTNHGRDSFDNAGATLSGTVRFCPAGETPPFANAYWDGARMYFGDGFAAADDVVGHELTHAVTEHTSGLIYADQSGAMNESLSDMWGEWIDLSNTGGTDTPAVRWLMGEDIPGIGAVRNMKDPTQFSNPDRMGSPYWYNGFDDNGGVHTNSGVGNKLCYLLTDGDTFNGYVVTGMGIPAAARLFYECQVHLLTPSSDYAGLSDALFQASVNLGLSQTETDNVKRACRAVEIYQGPPGVKAFRALSSSANTDIVLSWINPTAPGFQSVIVCRATGDYPTTTTAGTVVYSGTGTGLTDPGLTSGVTYYYSAWATYSSGEGSNPALAHATAGQDPPDYFTEIFTSEDNDLSSHTLTLTPDASARFYRAGSDVATGFPTDPSGGTVLSLLDDDYVAVSLSGGQQISLYGTSYNSFYIGSNGYITFGSGDWVYDETLAQHFSLPRISGLFRDLDPSQGGTISYIQLPDRVAVTYENVPEYWTSNSNSFQIEIFFDGNIHITWLSLDARAGLAGVSQGLGLPIDFTESDLTAYPPTPSCTISGRVTLGSNGLAGVTMTGLPGAPVVTDASGNFTGTVYQGWSGAVAPALVGFGFAPLSRAYSQLTLDQTSQDFAASVVPTHTVTGRVTLGGAGLGGVKLSGFPGSAVFTSPNGHYSATVNANWGGTVKPKKAGYSVAPPSVLYLGLPADMVQNYAAAVVLPADYFTEIFEQGDNDLTTHSLTLTPDGSRNFYHAVSRRATTFPVNPAGGTALSLYDDDYATIYLSGGHQFPFYGSNYNTFYVGSNGYITFGAGYTDYTPSLDAHFYAPEIAGLFDDLDPSSGGAISWKQLSDRAVVTYQNVPERGQTAGNSFQVEMFFNGTICLTWLGIAAHDGLAGISAGMGIPTDFHESDLTNYGPAYRLSYIPGNHGDISGTTVQVVSEGDSGASVTAVAAKGYHFTRWSDGSTANPRTDTNVMGNLSVTANFVVRPVVPLWIVH